jgi:PhnB protein
MASAVAYLTVDDGKAALAFYAEAFGAVAGEVYEDDGKLGHATLTVGGATFFVSDEYHEYGAWAPKSVGGHSTCAVVLSVDDLDAVWASAVAAGATVDREPSDQPGERRGWLIDPFGHRWAIAGR